MKTQSIRLVDVFLLGPFMLWSAGQSNDLPQWARVTLALAGLATIAYNADNWRRAGK